MLRIKTAGRGAFRGEPLKDNRKEPKYNLRVRRPQLKQQEVTLDSFTVAWSAHPMRGPSHISFRLLVTANFSAPVDPGRIAYRQYTRDRCSIRAGTDPGNLQFTTTGFSLDNYTVASEEGDVSQSGILFFQDNPGYTPVFGLDASTDINYTFGARWEIDLDGIGVLNTTALFGVISGPHRTFQLQGRQLIIHRFYFPSPIVNADWDFATDSWDLDRPSLLQAWPNLPPGFPVPAVVDP